MITTPRDAVLQNLHLHVSNQHGASQVGKAGRQWVATQFKCLSLRLCRLVHVPVASSILHVEKRKRKGWSSGWSFEVSEPRPHSSTLWCYLIINRRRFHSFLSSFLLLFLFPHRFCHRELLYDSPPTSLTRAKMLGRGPMARGGARKVQSENSMLPRPHPENQRLPQAGVVRVQKPFHLLSDSADGNS
jgi:hypothetical protein